MINAKKKVRSNSKPENRHHVFCNDCGVTFPSYSLTVVEALHHHKNIRKACNPNNGGNKRVAEDNYMEHEDSFGYDDIPDDFVDGAGDCLWRRIERPPIQITEEEGN